MVSVTVESRTITMTDLNTARIDVIWNVNVGGEIGEFLVPDSFEVHRDLGETPQAKGIVRRDTIEEIYQDIDDMFVGDWTQARKIHRGLDMYLGTQSEQEEEDDV